MTSNTIQTKADEENYWCRVNEDITDNDNTNQEGDVSKGISNQIDIDYSTLQNKCALLEKNIQVKNKLIQTYHTKLQEIVHAGTDVLILTGE